MGNVPPNHQTTTPRGQQTPIEANNNTTTTINDGTNEVNTHTYINAQPSTHNNNNNNNNNNIDMAETQPKSPPPPVAAPFNTTANDVKDKVVVCGISNELNNTNNSNNTTPSYALLNIRAAPSNKQTTTTAAPYTSLIANDNSLYPTAYPTKAKELMSLVGDSNIDALVVDMDYDKDLVCSVLANYNYQGFNYIKTNVWHQIINDVAIKQSERDYLNQSLSECNHQSPNRGNTNDTNNTRKDRGVNYNPAGVTDSMSKLRSPSGTAHSPMKQPTHNTKRPKQRTSNDRERDDTSTQPTSINTYSIDTHDITAPQINRTATTQSTPPFINPEVNTDSMDNMDIELQQRILNNPGRYLSTVKQETSGRGESPLGYNWQYDRGRAASSRNRSMPQNNNGRNSATNNNRATASTSLGSNMGSNLGSNSIRSNSNRTANVRAVTNSNQSSNGQASAANNIQSRAASSVDNNNNNNNNNNTDNTYTHPCTLESLLWSNEDSNTTSNSNVKSSQHPLDCYDDPDIDGDDSDMVRLCQLMDNHFEEAEQLLGHRVDNVHDLLRLLEERETNRDDWIPDGIEHPFLDTNWVLNKDVCKQLFGPKVNIGNRQCLSVAESKLVFGPYGISRELFPIYSHEKRRYNERSAEGKPFEYLQGLKCPCAGCKSEVKIARVEGGILVYEKTDPMTEEPYKHDKVAHKNHPNSTPMSLSFEQKEFVLKRMGKEPCSAICNDMLKDKSIDKTDEQKKNPKRLTKVISDYMSSKSTKNKYAMHDWRAEDFTGAETFAILESLKEEPGLVKETAFMESEYYQSMKDHINVIEHSYGPGGDKKLVLFETKDIAERIRLAGLMFDHEEGDNKNAVQISCDFADIPGTDMQLGTCGVDDFGRKQYLTSFCICPYENAEDAEKLMRATVERIDADERAKRDKALIDGAGALKKAARALRLRVRSCHAHIVRLALRRGGGKRGSKGSLSRYLLTNMGIGYKDMSKVVGDVHYGNYIPPKHKQDYDSFNELLWEKHDDLLHLRNSKKKTDDEKTKHVNHLKKTYLSHDPCCSGGRAVGIEGQSGSNQGGEKRGGQIKAYHKRITSRLSKEAKKSVIWIVAAVAMDLELDSNLSEFRTQPERKKDDYDHARKISQFDLEDSKCNLICDAQYMICTELGDHKKIIDTRAVIGDETRSFTAHLPTGSLVYSMVREMESETNNSSASFLEQPSLESEVADTPHKCLKILDKMSKNRSKSLMERLRHNLFENTPGRKPGENLFRFVQRRCQRNPSSNTTVRTVERIKEKKKKQWKKGLTAEEKEKEKYKWGDFSPDPEEDDINEALNESQDNVGKTDDDNGSVLYWTDEMDWSDVLNFLEKNGVDVGNDATLKSIDEAAKRVRLPRQLGDWIEVSVDAVTKRVKCNCEDFNTEGACYHVCTFEVLQFKRYPNQECQKGQESWSRIRDKCMEVLKKTFIQV